MTNNGGPAFPNLKVHDCGPRNPENAGMSLRDWFAGQALAGLLSQESEGWNTTAEKNAEMAFKLADAMFAERAKGGA